MISSRRNHLPEALPPNIIILRIRASTYESWREHKHLVWNNPKIHLLTGAPSMVKEAPSSGSLRQHSWMSLLEALRLCEGFIWKIYCRGQQDQVCKDRCRTFVPVGDRWFSLRSFSLEVRENPLSAAWTLDPRYFWLLLQVISLLPGWASSLWYPQSPVSSIKAKVLFLKPCLLPPARCLGSFLSHSFCFHLSR